MENNQTDKYAGLRLSNQLCFPLYACAKEVVRSYKPFLDELDLTYTQYIAMMVFWEEKEINVKARGERLYLDSGTLTPLLKKLEEKGYIKRERSKTDERNLIITLTGEGEMLKERAVAVPGKITGCINISKEDAQILHDILDKFLRENVHKDASNGKKDSGKSEK